MAHTYGLKNAVGLDRGGQLFQAFPVKDSAGLVWIGVYYPKGQVQNLASTGKMCWMGSYHGMHVLCIFLEVYHWASMGNEYTKYWELFINGKILHETLSVDGVFLRQRGGTDDK